MILFILHSEFHISEDPQQSIMSKRKRDVQDALSSLSELLNEREKEIEEREEKLLQAEKTFEKERNTAYGDTHPSDVLHLNIGGTTTAVLRRTLTSVPDSMLASKFSGRWDESLEKDKDGNFFIDQEFDLFMLMVNHLRKKSNGTDLYPVQSPSGDNDFYRLLEYYGMTHSIYPSKLTFVTGSKDTAEMISPLEVDSKDWATFKISSDGHQRNIKSYEVVLGAVQRIQIGWRYISFDLSADHSKGVGDVKQTLALDLTRSCYLLDGTITQIDSLEQKDGTVVRSEDWGRKWFVNGKLVASDSDSPEDGVVKSAGAERWKANHNNWAYMRAHMRPIISLKGQVQVTKVEFHD